MGSRNNVEEEEREKEGEEAVAARKLANVFLFWKNVYINWLDQSNKVFFFCSFSLSVAFLLLFWQKEVAQWMLTKTVVAIIDSHHSSINWHTYYIFIDCLQNFVLVRFLCPELRSFQFSSSRFFFLIKRCERKIRFDIRVPQLSSGIISLETEMGWTGSAHSLLFTLLFLFLSMCVCVFFCLYFSTWHLLETKKKRFTKSKRILDILMWRNRLREWTKNIYESYSWSLSLSHLEAEFSVCQVFDWYGKKARESSGGN